MAQHHLHNTSSTHDVIVVGARCGGSAVALLLARQGLRVLLVDRASFPSDTVSAHTIQPAGVATLARWGLLGVLGATGAPFVDTVRFDMGEFVLEGSPLPIDGISSMIAPRRHVLDSLMVEQARAAGVEVRTGFAVRELIVEHDRVVGVVGQDAAGRCEARARLVVGADGANSFVARAVGARAYNEVEATTIAAYTYYRGVDVASAELYVRPNRFTVALPTNDDTVIVSQVIARHDAAAFRADIATSFDDTLRSMPDLADRIAGGERIERFRVATETGGFFRVPCGPGWALVGDAGYHKDPITAQGMLDAYRDADLLAGAVATGFDGDLDGALAVYHEARDAAVADMYGFTCDLARVHEPPAPHVLELLRALEGNHHQIRRFHGLIAGSLPVSDFFAPDSVQAILGAAMAPA